MIQSHTVYLRLMDLTPADGGVYNCECTVKGNMSKIQLKVSVKVNEQDELQVSNSYANLILLCSVVSSVIIFGVILGCICWMCCRQRSEPAMTGGEEMETYAPLQRPTNDLYQTIHTFKQ
ncbi:hypothetical protein NL108_002620 [Boleophthalmus pectinirostris]|nr:hypothetical protein NL108_002620 [Boleophthalmus pectinirostris]